MADQDNNSLYDLSTILSQYSLRKESKELITEKNKATIAYHKSALSKSNSGSSLSDNATNAYIKKIESIDQALETTLTTEKKTELDSITETKLEKLGCSQEMITTFFTDSDTVNLGYDCLGKQLTASLSALDEIF